MREAILQDGESVEDARRRLSLVYLMSGGDIALEGIVEGELAALDEPDVANEPA